MATQTLGQAGLFINDEIVRGVVEDLIDINPIFAMLPFDAFTGQAVVLNRETATTFDDPNYVSDLVIGAQISGKIPMAFTQYTILPTKLIGDAEIDGLVQATSESAGVDQAALEISLKVKGIGHRFQKGMVMDPGTTSTMNSLHFYQTDADHGNGLGETQGGVALTFEMLDAVFEIPTSKGGQVDWGMAHPFTIREYKTLLRGTNGGPLGGTAADFVINVPFVNGRSRTVIAYEGTPIFRNDLMEATETAGGAALTTGATVSFWCGNFDDGSRRVGVAGIYPASVPAGITVERVGAKEVRDEEIWRIKWYTNFASYSNKGIARLTDLTIT